MKGKISSEIVEAFEKASTIASAIKGKITWFVLVGLLASIYLASLAYHVESELWWNLAKAGLILLPIVIWGILIILLAQIQQVPELIKSLSEQRNEVASVVQGVVSSEPASSSKLRSLFTLVRSIHSLDGFDEVMEASAGISLLINPFFMLITFISGVIVILMILVALLMLVF